MFFISQLALAAKDQKNKYFFKSEVKATAANSGKVWQPPKLYDGDQ